MLWNRPPSRLQCKVIIFAVFMLSGLFERYLEAVVLTLQQRGANYGDQAVFSICSYPLFIKVFFAPILDMYFVPAVGKCKTYLISFSLVLSAIALAYSGSVDSHLVPANIYAVTAVFVTMSLFETLYLIAGEMLIAKIFDSDEEKGIGCIVFDMSFAVGGFVSYNVFLPLNSQGRFSHGSMLRAMAAAFAAFALCLLLFFGEKHVQSTPVTYTKLFALAKTAVTKRHPRLLVLIILLLKAPTALVKESLNVKLVELGMDRTTVASVDTYTLVVYLFAGWGFCHLMTERRILRTGAALTGLYSLVACFKVWVLFDLHRRGDLRRTFFLYTLQSTLERFNYAVSFISGFITTSAPHDFSGTFMTFYFVLYNLGEKFPTTIGYLIINANYLDYFVYGTLVYMAQLLAVVLVYPYAVLLDEAPKSAFEIEATPAAEYHPLAEVKDRSDRSSSNQKRLIE